MQHSIQKRNQIQLENGQEAYAN